MQENLSTGRPFGQRAEEEPQQEWYEGEEPATEKEQAQYDLVVARAMKFMYRDGLNDVLGMISNGPNPAQGIGRAAATIAKRINESAKQANKPLEDGVLYHAGAEIVEELVTLGKKAGVFEFDSEGEEQNQTEEGFLWALKYYGEESLQDGTLDRQSAMQITQNMLAQEQAAQAETGAQMNPVSEGVRNAVNPAGIINSARG